MSFSVAEPQNPLHLWLTVRVEDPERWVKLLTDLESYALSTANLDLWVLEQLWGYNNLLGRLPGLRGQRKKQPIFSASLLFPRDILHEMQRRDQDYDKLLQCFKQFQANNPILKTLSFSEQVYFLYGKLTQFEPEVWEFAAVEWPENSRFTAARLFCLTPGNSLTAEQKATLVASLETRAQAALKRFLA